MIPPGILCSWNIAERIGGGEVVISHCLCKQQAICTPLPKHRPLWAPNFRGLRVGRDSELGSLRLGYSWKLSTACHREMSHAEGEGLTDFSQAAAIYQGGSVHHRSPGLKGRVGSHLMLLKTVPPLPASWHGLQGRTPGTLSPCKCLPQGGQMLFFDTLSPFI